MKFSASTVAGNAVLTLATQAVLAVMSIVFIPWMLRTFGADLYGVLTLTLLVLGNLGWLDLGMSRAAARFVAKEFALEREASAGSYVQVALLSQTIFSLPVVVALIAAAPTVVGWLGVSAVNAQHATLAVQVFGVVLPINFYASVMRGVAEARQRFDLINAITLAYSLATNLVYLTGLAVGSFELIVFGLLVVAILQLVLMALVALRLLPVIASWTHFWASLEHLRARIREMLVFGGWVSFNGFAGPILLNLDRWVITSILGVSTLVYYTVPFQLLSRLALLPGSLTSTLFPAFTSFEAEKDWKRIETYFFSAHRFLLFAVLPSIVCVHVWGPSFLRIWLGEEFAMQAATPLRFLTWGFLVALLAPLPGALLYGIGRPDVVGKVYALEIPLNALVVLSCTTAWGISGAAISFMIRAVCETLVLWLLTARICPLPAGAWMYTAIRMLVVSCLVFVGGWLLAEYGIRELWFGVGWSAVLLGLYSLIASRLLLDHSDRRMIRTFLSILGRRTRDRLMRVRVAT